MTSPNAFDSLTQVSEPLLPDDDYCFVTTGNYLEDLLGAFKVKSSYTAEAINFARNVETMDAHLTTPGSDQFKPPSLRSATAELGAFGTAECRCNHIIHHSIRTMFGEQQPVYHTLGHSGGNWVKLLSSVEDL